MANQAREDAIQAIVDTGKTPEQAEAFLAVLGSAMRRRGWIDGEPLSRDEIDAEMTTFMGEANDRG